MTGEHHVVEGCYPRLCAAVTAARGGRTQARFYVSWLCKGYARLSKMRRTVTISLTCITMKRYGSSLLV